MSKPKTEGCRPDGMNHKEHSAVVMNLALTIADGAARSDVECCARCDGKLLAKRGGHYVYDLSFPASGAAGFAVGTAEEVAEEVATAQRAARYIDLRMPHLPYVMHRDPANPNRVWFTDKE